MKEFDLIKFIVMATIVCLTIAGLFTIDYGRDFDWEGFKSFLSSDFKWETWHYLFLCCIVYFKK